MSIIKVFASGIAVLVTLLVCATVAGCSEATAESESPNLDVVAAAETGQEAPASPLQPPTVEDDQGQPAETRSPQAPITRAERPQIEQPRPRPTSVSPEVEPEERTQQVERRAEPSEVLQPEIVETEGIGVRQVALARTIEDRVPVDPSTTFSVEEGGRIYAYLEVTNPDREEGELTVAWARAEDLEDELSRVEVQVGAYPRWRTWAYTSRLNRPGRYMAIVRDHDGEVIARAPFEVTM